jgi:succinate dehydrogenase/fumarate reductase flavoprotein subunit
MNWNEYVKRNGVPDWPYPIRYGKESSVNTDVLVMGGGIAGCWAAISAARRGVDVVLVEKGATINSGAGGTGCDHWINTPHPGSSITAEEAVEWELEFSGGYTNGISRYIAARESYETLLELEQMGAKIRDTDDQFDQAPFRDEKTKFLFAYDYKNRIHFRVWGSTFKPALHKTCKKLGVNVLDRIMLTGLLTRKGKIGSQVVGATGLHTRTGEFFVFRAKATIDCLSRHQRNWCFSSELRGLSSFRPPTIVGDGHAMAWRAGAEFTMMERSMPTSFGSGNVYPPYGHGNAINSWFPCNIVDANGKQIPYADRDGKILQTEIERSFPATDQKFLGERTTAYAHKRPELIPDIEKRVRKGEYVLPFYSDLSAMSAHERQVIWGMMIGEEGKTRVPILQTYQKAGFDPANDLLQSYIFLGGDPMRGSVRPQERTGGEIGDAGGLLVDWELKSTLEGLYAAGDALFAGNYHYHAAATGRYAGRKAAEYSQKVRFPTLYRKQVANEKARAYAPLENGDDIEWKELNAAICRIMQNYCGDFKNEELFKIGLIWLEDLKCNETPRVQADNPHKLMRTLEVYNILTCCEMIIHASMARRASAPYLGFFRQDYPEIDPAEWHKWVTIRIEESGIKTGTLPIDFWAPMAENYEKHHK